MLSRLVFLRSSRSWSRKVLVLCLFKATTSELRAIQPQNWAARVLQLKSSFLSKALGWQYKRLIRISRHGRDFALSNFSILFSCWTLILPLPSCSSVFNQPRSCSEAALSLLTCIEELDCVKNQKKTAYDCLKDPVESDDCRAQRNAYTMCKHSQLNMRTRIRGVRTY